MIRKRFIIILMSVLMLLALVACSGATTVEVGSETISAVVAGSDTAAGDTVAVSEVVATAPASAAEALAETAATQEPAATSAVAVTDAAAAVADNSAVAITLSGDAIAADGAGVTVNGTVATITAAGTYTISGALSDGQIVVDTEDEAVVTLVLNGVDISNSTTAPIAILNAEDAVILLADNTANNVTDAASYVFPNAEEDEPNAAIFSNAGLTISGNGSLTVTGNYNDAISSDDTLVITSGTITVNAVDDGLRGKDTLLIQGGTINVVATGDGLKSDNEDDATLGYVAIEGGVINVAAQGDAIAAQTDVLITGGEFNLSAGGGSGAQIAEDASAKGIKGLANVLIDNGTFVIDSADDAIHSNGNITINGGTFTLSTGDDGLHADVTLTVNGGSITIPTSYEGLESAVITLNAGDINVTASDDGINVAGGVDGSGQMAGPGRGGRGQGGPGAQTGEVTTYSGSYYLYINGGTVVVNAQGDGLDANGAIEMTGGVVVVNGPTESMNGALDYDGTFNISGGTLIAVGSSGMAQAPSSGSTQSAVLMNVSGQSAGTLINLQSAAGESVLTFAPAKSYASILFSSPDLAQGTTYTLNLGGSATGTSVGGLYTDGTYSGGTEYGGFTQSSVVTMHGGQSR